MPITDTSFIEQNEARRQKLMQEMMAGIKKKESPERKLAVVILAAGLGKRMKSPDKPKVMFELNGKPLIGFVVDLAVRINADRIIPIVGHHRELVIDYLEKNYDYNFEFAIQHEQLGTGHAVMQTEEPLEDFDGDVLILSGDVPLLKFETVERLVNEHFDKGHTATLLTATVKDASGYGRIMHDVNGKFVKIVEDKDATDIEKKINEINPAIYVVNSKTLFDALKKIKPENKQNEYYLTDIFYHIPINKVGTVAVADENEIKGINSLEQLKEMENLLG